MENSYLVFLVRRLIFTIFVLISVTLITFTLSHIVPTDPARLLAGPHANSEVVANVRAIYGLDKPLPAQYLTYMSGLLRLNFGQSIRTKRPVLTDLRDYLPATIELILAAMLITVIIGLPLGIVGAVYKSRIPDYLSRLVSLLGVSIPVFWLALLAQLVLYYRLGWLPSGARLDIGMAAPPTVTGFYTIDSLLTQDGTLFANSLYHLIMPSAILALSSFAVVSRMLRASLIEVLTEPYIVVARAKGLTEPVVIGKHALKNAVLPTITVLGLQMGYLVSGAVLVEILFSWPGIGRYAVDSIVAGDYNGIMSVTLIIATIYALINFGVDLLYAWLDPRVTLG
jgi:peptide/nickel transport system permease protein